LSRDGALRRTILIVDDDRDIREVTADALEAEGYLTATAGDGRAALAWLRVHHSQPCLVLLDLMMPDMDAAAFREQLRDPVLSDIAVVVFSADAGVAEKARSMGAVGYLKKPVGLLELLDVVRAVCGGPLPSP
jgi:CheY-like chemotaxis protein